MKIGLMHLKERERLASRASYITWESPSPSSQCCIGHRPSTSDTMLFVMLCKESGELRLDQPSGMRLIQQAGGYVNTERRAESPYCQKPR